MLSSLLEMAQLGNSGAYSNKACALSTGYCALLQNKA